MGTEFITAEEIVTELTAVKIETSKRTVDRQLAGIKANDPDNYNRIVKHDGKKLLYKKALILPYLIEFKSRKKAWGKTAKAETPTPRNSSGAPNAKVKGATEPGKPGKVSKPEQRANYAPPAPDLNDALEDLLNAPTLLYQPTRFEVETLARLTGNNKTRFEYAISICAEYATGLYTLEYCTTKYNIPQNTFWEWRCRIEEIALLFKNARAKRAKNMNLLIRDAAETALITLVQGREYIERSKTYEKHLNPDGSYFSVEKESRETNRVIMPNLGAAIFTLVNRAPEKWKNRQTHTNEDAAPLKPENKLAERSDAELLEIAVKNLNLSAEDLKALNLNPPAND